MIITWTTTLRKFGACIPWFDCKQSTQKCEENVLSSMMALEVYISHKCINILHTHAHFTYGDIVGACLQRYVTYIYTQTMLLFTSDIVTVYI